MAGEWRKMTFSEAVIVNPRVELKRGSEYPFVDMQAVNSISRYSYSSEQRSFEGGGSRFATGDTLMARITPCLENGKIARFCSHHASVAHGSTEFIVIRGREGVTDTDYAYYLTKWEGVSGYAISQMTGTSGRQRVPTESLDHLVVPIPSLPEQRAIAHILGTLDDKIELNRRMNETLEAMARAIFKSWFVDFDPIPGHDSHKEWQDSPFGRIPKGWRVAPIGDVVKVVGGSTPRTSEPRYWDGDIHFATPKDLAALTSSILLDTERRITKAGLDCISSGLLPNGTVLLSSRAPIGYLAITEIPIAVNQGFIAMVCDGELPNHYVLHWTEENMEVIKGKANGTTFLEISKSNFRPIPAIVPSPSVLEKFVAAVGPLHRQIATNLHQSRTLAAIRDALLPKLISGKIRISEAEKSVEELA